MFTIQEFCKHARISRSLYYSLQRRGKGPAETKIGTRVLIAEETAREWLKSQERPCSSRELASAARAWRKQYASASPGQER